jgi:hypothetical protein
VVHLETSVFTLRFEQANDHERRAQWRPLLTLWPPHRVRQCRPQVVVTWKLDGWPPGKTALHCISVFKFVLFGRTLNACKTNRIELVIKSNQLKFCSPQTWSEDPISIVPADVFPHLCQNDVFDQSEDRSNFVREPRVTSPNHVYNLQVWSLCYDLIMYSLTHSHSRFLFLWILRITYTP